MIPTLKNFFCATVAMCFVAAAEAGTADTFLSVVQTNFPAWDLNHDGVLSSNELDVVVADTHTTGTNAAVVAALKRASRGAKISVPPLTLETIAKVTEQKQPDLAQMFADGLKRISGATNRNLFAEGLPRLETIHQGKLGNCFTLAPLGAMVHRDPAQVAAMFAAEANGNYRVRLGKKNVEVTPPTDAELAMSSSNEHEGIWVNIYEKAIGTARNDDRPPETRVALPMDAIARGGSAGTMLAYITGHEIKRFPFKFAKSPPSATNDIPAQLAELRKELQAATKEKRLMTTGTIKPTTPGLTPNHAYAVLGYEAASDAVSLWNPHGQEFVPKGKPGKENGYPTKNGIFEIPVPQFVEQFSGMAFEVRTEKIPVE